MHANEIERKMPMPPINLLIKPASGNCNLRCSYCFYYDITGKREQESYGFMSEETLEQVIKQALFFASGECSFAYQGGEPTLRGLDFFRKSLEFQQKHNVNNVKINNAIQTNGYRLSEEWAKFFAEHHFLVGLSLDGYKGAHDKYRRNGQGEETFLEILKTIEMFQKYQVEFNILTVVNRKSCQKVSKMYQFFQQHNLHYLQFIPCLDPLDEIPGQREYSLLPEEYGEFLKELFDLWYEDLKQGKNPYIRQFENYIGILMGHPPEACDQCGVCNLQYVVEADGEVYPCDFYVLDEFKLGNLNQVGIEEINKKRQEIRFIEYSKTDHPQCNRCKYGLICRGGCRRHRSIENTEGYHDNYFCQSYQMLFDHAIDRMLQIARVLKQQR